MSEVSEPLRNGLEYSLLFRVLSGVTEEHPSFRQVTEDLFKTVPVGERACRNDGDIVELCSSE